MKRRRAWAQSVVGGVLALCLLVCGVCVGAQPALQRWPLGYGYVMSACFVLDSPPQAQVGVEWVSPFISSALPPFRGPAANCFTIPWLPLLPPRGEILFPP